MSSRLMISAPSKNSVVCAGIVLADIIVRSFAGLPEPGSLKLLERIEL